MSKAWRGGSTSAWRRVRAAVLRDNLVENEGRCVLQVEGVCSGQANTVHHTLGRAVTGDDRRYLVAACADCNLHVGEPKHDTPPHRPVSRW